MTLTSLKILRGVDLVAMDNNWTTADASDPYCEVYVNGTQLVRTPVQSQTLNPIWGGPASMCVFDAEEDDKITIKIFDYDNFKSDDSMGEVSFKASDILAKTAAGGYPNVWCPVEPPNGYKKNSGMLELRMLRKDVSPSSSLHEQISLTEKRELRQSAILNLSAGPKLKSRGISKDNLHRMIVSSTAPVTLHVYDVSNDKRVAGLNSITKLTGGGVFHAAVEVFGTEYSFGGSRREISGIFFGRPRQCPMHHYRESFFLGDCDLQPSQVNDIVSKMKPEWMAPTYTLLRKNCCNFSQEFAIELGVGSLPPFVSSLAQLGGKVDDFLAGKKKKKKKRTTHGKMVHVVRPNKERAYEEEEIGVEVGIEVAHLAKDFETLNLDEIMASRVQKAYRASCINRKIASQRAVNTEGRRIMVQSKRRGTCNENGIELTLSMVEPSVDSEASPRSTAIYSLGTPPLEGKREDHGSA